MCYYTIYIIHNFLLTQRQDTSKNRIYVTCLKGFNHYPLCFIQLFLDQSHETIEVKPVDFFKEHTTNVNSCNDNFLSNNFIPFTSPKQVCVIKFFFFIIINIVKF